MTGTSVASPLLVGVTGAGLSWLMVNLLGITRSPQSGIGWYRMISLLESGAAVYSGFAFHIPAWVALGFAWALVKIWWVPIVLHRGLPGTTYGAQARGTPGLIGGSLALAAIVTWALGNPGVLLAALLTPFWILTQRREVWLQILLLLEAELVLGFTGIAFSQRVGMADFIAVAELLALAVLLAWLHVRGSRDTVPAPTTHDLQQLRG